MKARTKRSVLRVLTLFIFLAMATLGGYLLNQWLQYRKARFTHYPEFGIPIPEAYMIHGIDVSRYQQLIAWDAVAAMKIRQVSIGFAFIKATEGVDNVDPQFRRNWRKSKANGIVRGAYHFFIASKDGKMQAENFIDRVELEPGDLPPVLDVEQLNGMNPLGLKTGIRAWLKTAEDYYHVRPIIYTNIDFYKRYLGDDFNDYPLWIAHYYETNQPRTQRTWLFWQHNDGGNVNGIIPKVDFNVFNGDSSAFRSILIH